MFNIAEQKKIASREDEGTVVHLFDLNDAPMFYVDPKHPELGQRPITITVAGVHSEKYRKIEAQYRQKKLKSSRLTTEALHQEQISKIASCTLDWEGFGDAHGFTPCSYAAAKALYEECSWVLDQINEAMNDHTRFFGKESSTPENTSGTTPDSTNE